MENSPRPTTRKFWCECLGSFKANTIRIVCGLADEIANPELTSFLIPVALVCERADQPPVQSENMSAMQSPRFAQLARPLLYALGIVTLIIGLFELVERTWLTGLEMEFCTACTHGEDVFSSLVVALVVQLDIIKASPTFPGASPVEDEWPQQAALECGRNLRPVVRAMR